MTSPAPRPSGWDDLTLPLTGTATIRALVAADLRRWTEALRHWPLATLTPPTRALAAAGIGAWLELHRRQPAASWALLRQPTLAVWAELGARGLAGVAVAQQPAWEAWSASLGLTLLVELAAGGQLLRPTPWLARPGSWPRVLLPRMGLALTLDPAITAVRFDPAAMRWRVGDARREHDPDSCDDEAASESWAFVAGPPPAALAPTRSYAPIRQGLLLAGVDNNPLAHVEAHPDKRGNAIDLGGHPPAAWCAALQAALAIVERHLPEIDAEIRLLLQLCLPVGYDAERHLSASFQELIGAIYLTLHPQTMTLAEAIIHEFQHNKLNAALHHQPLLHNAFWPLFPSPVRPDPRPLHGVLLAVHAFQPVALLYLRMRAAAAPEAAAPAFAGRGAVVCATVRAGTATLRAHAAWTDAGARYAAEMERLDAEIAAEAAAAGWEVPATQDEL